MTLRAVATDFHLTPGLPVPDPTDPRCLAYVAFDGYRLLLWDACKADPDPRRDSGHVGYALWDGDTLVKTGEDYGPSAMPSLVEDDAAVRELLRLLGSPPEEDETRLTEDLYLWGNDHEDCRDVSGNLVHEPYTFEPLRKYDFLGHHGDLARSRRQFVGRLLLGWHGGTDAVYAVGSYWIDDRVYPVKAVVERALVLVRSHLEREHGWLYLDAKGSSAGDGRPDEHRRNVVELTFIEAYLVEALAADYSDTIQQTA